MRHLARNNVNGFDGVCVFDMPPKVARKKKGSVSEANSENSDMEVEGGVAG